MSESPADVLLHPVRIRIAQAAAGREVTIAQLAEELADVPAASLYRHVARLVDAGMLEVVRTRQVRGGAERTYRLVADAASLRAQDVAGVGAREHLDYLSAFLGAVLERATAYLRSPSADPAADGFGYRQVALWLTEDELNELLDIVGRHVRSAAEQGPAPGRRRRLLTTVLVPDPLDLDDGGPSRA